jgi:hypothetical protein
MVKVGENTYAAGYDNGSHSICVWKGNNKTSLTLPTIDGKTVKNGNVTGICSGGTNIYISGYALVYGSEETNPSYGIGCLWTSNDSGATWTTTIIANTNNTSGIYPTVTDIAATSSSVKLVGHTYSMTEKTTTAMMWDQNGNQTVLHENRSNAKAIVISSGGNAFVAGNCNGRAVLWKDSATSISMTELSSELSSTTCIAIKGDNIYVGGELYDKTEPLYWKTTTSLATPEKHKLYTNSNGHFYVDAIAANDSHVVTAGHGGYTLSCYWIDNSLTIMPYKSDAEFSYVSF